VELPSDASSLAVAEDDEVADVVDVDEVDEVVVIPPVVELVGEVAMWSRTTGLIAFKGWPDLFRPVPSSVFRAAIGIEAQLTGTLTSARRAFRRA
jgi:hypothetical protein